MILQSPLFAGESNEDQLACIAELLGPFRKELFFVPAPTPTEDNANANPQAAAPIPTNNKSNPSPAPVAAPPATPKASSISPAMVNRQNSIKGTNSSPIASHKKSPHPGNYLLKQKSKSFNNAGKNKDLTNRPLSTIKTIALPYKSPSGKWRKYHSIQLETFLTNFFQDPIQQVPLLFLPPISSASSPAASYYFQKKKLFGNNARRPPSSPNNHQMRTPRSRDGRVRTPSSSSRAASSGGGMGQSLDDEEAVPVGPTLLSIVQPGQSAEDAMAMELDMATNFLRNCLTYLASERSSIEELVCHLWFNNSSMARR